MMRGFFPGLKIAAAMTMAFVSKFQVRCRGLVHGHDDADVPPRR
jgi:hypothetical protein